MQVIGNKILFIGAGASFGAREGTKPSPPLGLNLCNWLKNKGSALLRNSSLADLRPTIKNALAIINKYTETSNFEELCSKLKQKERLSIQRLLQIMFTDLTERNIRCDIDLGFKNQEDGYDALIKKLNIDHSWTIISLNYDILFEEALRRQSINFFYPNFPFHLNGPIDLRNIPIYKPHGSINFFASADIRVSADELNTPQFPTKINGTSNQKAIPNFPYVFSTSPKADNILMSTKQTSTCYPVMANYTKGKGVDINDQSLKKVREAALEICKNTNEIIIIGVKPIRDKSDDDFVANLLQYDYDSIKYISASSQDCTTIHECYPLAEIHCNGLFKFLESIR